MLMRVLWVCVRQNRQGDGLWFCNGRVKIVCITRDLSSGKGLLLWSEEKMSSENDPNSVGGGVIGVAIANIVT